jgi:hypothetical protein
VSAVDVEGEINDPSPGASSKGWGVTVMIPFKDIFSLLNQKEAFPKPGAFWRINFSRVEVCRSSEAGVLLVR